MEYPFRPQKTKKRVFISFHKKDIIYKTLLQQQAKSDKYELEFTDYSINEPFDEKWKTNCRDRMGRVSAIICLIGEETASREAVCWELEKGFELDKQVFGVKIFRNKFHSIPRPLTQNGAAVINWNLADIVKELNK